MANQPTRSTHARATAMSRARTPAAAPVPRPRRALVALALPLVVVLAGIVSVVVGIAVLGIVLIVVALASVAANAALASSDRVLASLGTRALNRENEPRLVNVVEGLCVANGLRVPELRVLEDAAPNALSLARRGGPSILVVTRGLLELLDRIELEGVVAHELAHLKSGDVIDVARAWRAVGLLAYMSDATAEICLNLGRPEREVLADLSGCEMTRYPPGLVAALSKIGAAPGVRPAGLTKPVARLTGAFWCAPFGERPSAKVRPGVLDLPLRISALAEL